MFFVYHLKINSFLLKLTASSISTADEMGRILSLLDGVDYGQMQCFGNQIRLRYVLFDILPQYRVVNKIR